VVVVVMVVVMVVLVAIPLEGRLLICLASFSLQQRGARGRISS
jgi:hypothetical protein